jgi:Gas vesicle synthesis protein GvpL/GvpF
VLPLRFGTLVPDEAAAHRLLATHAATARTQLERIGNAREWGVRLVRTLTADPVPAPAGAEVSGTEFLSRRRQALTEAERAGAAAERAADRLEAALEPHTRARLRRGGSPGSSLLLDLAFLVEPDSEAAVTAALEQLAADEAANGLALELSGPWPPYSFASLTEEVPGGA